MPVNRKLPATRSQKWRLAIIVVEVLVLVTVLLAARAQGNTRNVMGADESAQSIIVRQETTNIENRIAVSGDTTGRHRVAVWVDVDYVVHIYDNGVSIELAQLQPCANQMLDYHASPTLRAFGHGVPIYLASILHGYTFRADGYEAVATDTRVIITTTSYGTYELWLDCTR